MLTTKSCNPTDLVSLQGVYTFMYTGMEIWFILSDEGKAAPLDGSGVERKRNRGVCFQLVR